MSETDRATNVGQITKDDTLDFVLRRYDLAYDDTQALREKYDDWYDHYRCYRDQPVDEAENKLRSNVFIPLSYQAVETILARYLEAFFSQQPYFRMVGREPQDDENANLLTMFYHWQLEQAMFYFSARQSIKDSLIYGAGITKVYWTQKSHVEKTEVPLSLAGMSFLGSEEREEQIIDYDGIMYEPVHIKDFFIDPEATEIDNARYCGCKYRRSIEYLKKMAESGYYKNIDQIEMPASPTDGGDESGHKTSRVADGQNEESNDTTGMVEIIEYQEPTQIVVIANRKVVIRNVENPYGFLTYIAARTNIDTAKFWGRGIIEPAESLADLTNSMFNVAMDNLNFSVNKQWIANKNMIIEPSELTNTPGGIIWTRGTVRDSLREVETVPLSADVYRMLVAIQEFHKKTTGAIDLLQGVPQEGASTATEASITAKEGISRVQMGIKALEEEYMKPALKKAHAMNKRFLNDQVYFRVINYPQSPFETLKMERQNLVGDYDFIFEAASRHLSQQRDRIELQQMLQTISGNPAMIPIAVIVIEKILKQSGIHPNDELKKAMEMSKKLAGMMLMAQLVPPGADRGEKRPPNAESEVQKNRMRGAYN